MTQHIQHLIQQEAGQPHAAPDLHRLAGDLVRLSMVAAAVHRAQAVRSPGPSQTPLLEMTR